MPTTVSRKVVEPLPMVLDRVKGCCGPVAEPLPRRDADELAALGKALADPTRVQMLHMLKHAVAPVCVCDFTAVFECGQPTVSHHLARLREAGLVQSSKQAIWTIHQLCQDLSPAARAALELIP